MATIKRAKSKEEKLAFLKSVLNGTLSFEYLRPPATYAVFKTNGSYRVRDKLLNQEEFQAWKAGTIRDMDTLIVWDETKSYDDETGARDEAEQAQKEAKNEKPALRPLTSLEALKEKIKPLQEAPGAGKDPVRVAAPEEKSNAGLLSEYGETWGLKEDSEGNMYLFNR